MSTRLEGLIATFENAARGAQFDDWRNYLTRIMAALERQSKHGNDRKAGGLSGGAITAIGSSSFSWHERAMVLQLTEFMTFFVVDVQCFSTCPVFPSRRPTDTQRGHGRVCTTCICVYLELTKSGSGSGLSTFFFCDVYIAIIRQYNWQRR